MAKILASLVSGLKTTVTNISKLAVSATHNTKLQLGNLGYKVKTKAILTVNSAKLTITSSKIKLKTLTQTSKIAATYSLGIFFTNVNSIRIAAINTSKITSIINYITRTKLKTIVQTGKAKLQLSYHKTNLAVTEHKKTIIKLTYISKIKAQQIAGVFFIDIIRAYEDAVALVETTFLKFVKNLGDQATISDITSILVDYNKVYTDKPIILDTISFSNTYDRVFSDSVTLTDFADPVTLNKEENFVGTSDLVTLLSSYAPRITDIASITDNITSIKDFYREYYDISSITDTVNFSNSFIRNYVENISISDTTFVQIGFNAIQSENLSSYDLISLIIEPNITDDTILLDNVLILSEYLPDIADDTSIVEDIFAGLNVVFFGEEYTEVAEIVDSLEFSNEYYREYADVVSITDSISIDVFNQFYRDYDENISITDDIVITSEFNFNFTEDVYFVDDLLLQVGYNDIPKDEIYIDELIDTISNYLPNITDSTILTEILETVSEVYIEYFDSTAIIDNVLIQRGFNRLPIEYTYINDDITLERGFGILPVDYTYIIDSIGTTSQYLPTIEDDAALITEILEFTIETYREVSDINLITDDILVSRGIYTLDTEEVLSIDVVDTIVDYLPDIYNITSIVESVESLSEVYRNYLDTTLISDIISISAEFDRQFDDNISTFDNTFIQLQLNQLPLDEIFVTDVTTIITEYLPSILDQVISIESIQILAETVREYIENISTTDSIFVSRGSYNYVDEEILGTDLVDTIANYLPNIYETSPVIDSIELIIEGYREYLDNVVAQDFIITSVGFNNFFYETNYIDDVVALHLKVNIVPGELLFVTDLAITTSEYLPTILDQVINIESIQILSETVREYIENISTTDSILVSRGSYSYADEEILSTDLVNTIAGYSPIVNEVVITSDNIQSLKEIYRDYLDTATIVDTLTIYSGFSRLSEDSVSITDDVVALIGLGQLITDQTSTSDIVDTISNYLPVISDTVATVAIIESIEALNSVYRQLFDNTYTVDYVIPQLGLNQYAEDSISINDDVLLDFTLRQVPAEYVSTVDIISTISTFISEIIDNTIIVENISKFTEYYRDYADEASIADYVIAQRGVSDNPIDIVSISDLVDIVSAYLPQINEVSTLLETVTIINEFYKDYTDTILSTETVKVQIGSSYIDTINIADNIALQATFYTSLTDITNTYDLVSLDIINPNTEDIISIDNISTLSSYAPDIEDPVYITEYIFAGLNVKDLLYTEDISILAEDSTSLEIVKIVLGESQDYSDNRFYFLESYIEPGPGEFTYLDDEISIGIQNNYLENILITETVDIYQGFYNIPIDTILVEDLITTQSNINSSIIDNITSSDLPEIIVTIPNTESISLTEETFNTINPYVLENASILEDIFAGLNVQELLYLTELGISVEDFSSIEFGVTVLGESQDYADNRFYFLESYVESGPGEFSYLEDELNIDVEVSYLENIVLAETIDISIGFNTVFTDTISVIDGIIIVSQDYYQEDYVDPEYTGSTILSYTG